MNYSIEAYKEEINLVAGNDPYERYDQCFLLLFDIATELDYREVSYPSINWEYESGASDDMREREGYWFELLEDESTEQLIKLGDLLYRYIGILDKKLGL